MFEKIKEIRRTIASHDATFWEVAPALITIFLPSIFEPEWFWRSVSLFVASATMFVLCIHGLLAPEQIAKFKNVRSQQTKKILFWLLYVTGIFLTPFILFFFLIPSGGDLYRIIQDSSSALEEKTIEVDEWGGGGSVAPFFIGQRFGVAGDNYYLSFSFHAWGVGTFEILYSPATNFIYEIKKLQ